MSVLPGSPHEPGFVAETLAWCNARRAEKGMEPLDRLPKGMRSSPLSCPCGRATRLSVGFATYRQPGSSIRHSVPEAVSRFVEAFDEGGLPQYDEAVSA